MKKIVAFVSSLAVMSNLLIPHGMVSAKDYNYGEALQKSIMFYEFQRAGKLPEDTRNNWRGDSALSDGSEVGLDLTKGWFDAGDHVKFNLPMAYSATMLGWSVYEARDAYKKSGQLPFILDNIKWATDYFINCHPSPNVYYYQVGDGQIDHSWWGPAEVMQMKRPAFKVDKASPGSTVVAETAAALAVASIIFKESDPTYSATCIKHAQELFEFADTTKSDAGYIKATGFYQSHSGFYDELTWAGIWLYLATNDKVYLDKAESYEPNWERERGTTTIKYKWAHCWDNKLFGALMLMAKATNKEIYKENLERNLDWWTTGVDGNKIAYTPKGLAWLDTWGSLRYATTQAFLGAVYSDWSGADPVKAKTYWDFAKSQVDYALGSAGRSFLIGFGTNPPKRPHHRTAHASWYGTADIPEEPRHVLVGALVGGPSQTDSYTDSIGDYISNEVACDYNAGIVGALAKMYGKYGGDPIPDYKAIEPVGEEFSIDAGINASGFGFISIRASISNKTAWPARGSDKLSYKYFVDISEGLEAGLTLKDFRVESTTNAGSKVSQLLPWDEKNNIYYVNIDFSGILIAPSGVNDYKRDVYFSINAPYGEKNWDNSNDFSFKGLEKATGQSGVVTKYIPIYENGVKISGEEPGGGSATPQPTIKISPTPVPTVSPTSEPTIPPQPTSPISVKLGDLNYDDEINSIDIAILKRYILGLYNLPPSMTDMEKFYKAADVNVDGKIDSTDLAFMKRRILNIISKFPAE